MRLTTAAVSPMRNVYSSGSRFAPLPLLPLPVLASSGAGSIVLAVARWLPGPLQLRETRKAHPTRRLANVGMGLLYHERGQSVRFRGGLARVIVKCVGTLSATLNVIGKILNGRFSFHHEVLNDIPHRQEANQLALFDHRKV